VKAKNIERVPRELASATLSPVPSDPKRLKRACASCQMPPSHSDASRRRWRRCKRRRANRSVINRALGPLSRFAADRLSFVFRLSCGPEKIDWNEESRSRRTRAMVAPAVISQKKQALCPHLVSWIAIAQTGRVSIFSPTCGIRCSAGLVLDRQFEHTRATSADPGNSTTKKAVRLIEHVGNPAPSYQVGEHLVPSADARYG